MTVDQFLSRLDGVRPRGTGKWSARCPAHPDKTPSLSISDGERGLLVKCWAGCSLMEICASLGIKQRDLFFDSAISRHSSFTPSRPARLDRVALAWRFELAAFDRRERAARIVDAGKHVNVAVLTEEELDRALAYMAQAYADIERAELFEGLADDLRARDFSERKAREQQSCAA